MNAFRFVFFCVIFLLARSIQAEDASDNGKAPAIIYLQPNTTQLFTELYQAYGLLHPPEKTVFEEALYLDQSNLTTIVPLQLSNREIFKQASDILSAFHRRSGDLELYIDPAKPEPFFYTACGSKHLIVALVYAIAMSEPSRKFLFVEQAPFYSGHPNAVNGLFSYPNARFLSFHNPSEIQLQPEEVLVEFVTSPNNPDGKIRKPLTNAAILIADFVFASSVFGSDGTGYLKQNLDWIRKARSEGKHVFSFNSASKQFGKTGARCGYIWFPLYDEYASSIFKKFFGFISSSTVAGGSIGLADFLNLIQALGELPDGGEALRQDGGKSLRMRHAKVAVEFLRRYPGSTVISIPGSSTVFAKMNDPRVPKEKAADILFQDLRATVNNGEPMGESNEFIRLNLTGFSGILAEFLNRLSGGDNYTASDLFFSSSEICSHSRVCASASSRSEPTLYTVHTGDCLIEADAAQGPIEIRFPPFIDFEASRIISVKKADASSHPVAIRAPKFSQILKKEGEMLRLFWTQPLYLDGHWQIVEQESNR